MRLWEALDQGLLCPFHYLGVGDGTDLRGVGFRARTLRDVRTRRRPDRRPHSRPARSSSRSTSGSSIRRRCGRWGSASASTTRGSWPSSSTTAGLPAVALDGDTDAADPARGGRATPTRRTPRDLHGRHLQRGRRHPGGRHASCCLRPTESATVFLQQLGPRPPLGRRQERPDGAGLHRAGARGLPIRHPVPSDGRRNATAGGAGRRSRLPAHAAGLRHPAGRDRARDRAGEPAVEHPEHAARARRRPSRPARQPRPWPSSSTPARSTSRTSTASPESGTTFTSRCARPATPRRAASPTRPTSPGRLADAPRRRRRALSSDGDSGSPPKLRPGTGRTWDRAKSGCSGCCSPRSVSAAGRWPRLSRRSLNSGDAPALREELRRAPRRPPGARAPRLAVRSTDWRGADPQSRDYGLYEIIAAYGLVSNGRLRENREGVAVGRGRQVGPVLHHTEQGRRGLLADDPLPGLPDLADALPLGVPVADASDSPPVSVTSTMSRAARVVLFVRETGATNAASAPVSVSRRSAPCQPPIRAPMQDRLGARAADAGRDLQPCEGRRRLAEVVVCGPPPKVAPSSVAQQRSPKTTPLLRVTFAPSVLPTSLWKM